MKTKIIWTKTDEAPYLATHSLFPIVEAFTKNAGVELETRDISLAGRILATFPDYLTEEQRINDDLAYLGELVNQPEANIIKLPNISASIPQLKAAIEELRSKGYMVPEYPEEPQNDKEKEIKARYAKCLGSAVNPVLRQGNSDRRVAPSVKNFAKKYPHTLKDWDTNSKTHVAHMDENDFYGNEKSITVNEATTVRYELHKDDGTVEILKKEIKLDAGEVLDGTFMSARHLSEFAEKQIKEAKEQDVLFSVHLKATMMKVSDPIIFGHFVKNYLKDVFEKYDTEFKEIGVIPDLGIGDIYKKLEKLPEAKRNEIKEAIETTLKHNAPLAMFDSDKGITNLHAPNLIIIDASMPPLIRDGGKMWGPDGQLHQTKAVIPDRTYAVIYKEVVDYHKENGAFNPATMGNVSNVGLMAMKAEEYGSHDKTFKIPANGTVKIIDNNTNEVLMEHKVEKDDIYRSCQVKDIAIKDWVKLAVRRARETGNPAVFWLDKNRAHDAQIIKKVEQYLAGENTDGLEIKIMPPQEAMRYTLDRVKAGKDTISVTGNVLRDYLTDLFPILELGTSAKMLSIVPLLAGGGLFETGAGGSAPKHVTQFVEEGHLRWDSLGEFLALTVSLEHYAKQTDNPKAKLLGETLDKAITKILENGKSPKRKAGELDNRGSHFYLAMYWAQELAAQEEDTELKKMFAPVAKALEENETQIMEEINATQGTPINIGGYYWPDEEKVTTAMRPSKTFNEIIDSLVKVGVH